MKTAVPCSVSQGKFRGWDAAFLQNGLIRLAAVPDIGGRLMAYDLGPYPYLFVDPELAGKLFTPQENEGDGSLAAWKNYGGDKTWPAPQGWDNDQQWHGPPDPVLDTGRYTMDALTEDGESALVRMVSPPDRRTGVQITRQATIRPGSSRVTLDLTFRNISNRTVRWSIWDVVQLNAQRETAGGKRRHDPNCTVTTPLNPNSPFPRGYNVMFGEENNPQWKVDRENGLFVGTYLWEIGKVGIDSPAGWIAFSHGSRGYAFAEQFPYDAQGEYPDQGVTVECWTVGAGQVGNLDYEQSDIYLMETEVLSPMRTIEPGRSSTFTIEWGACRCPGPIIEVTPGGCIAQKPILKGEQDFAHLSGQVGVFDAGRLSLAWRDNQNGLLLQENLGPVDPLTAVLLDRVTPLPSGAAAVDIQVTAAADGQTHLLSRALLE